MTRPSLADSGITERNASRLVRRPRQTARRAALRRVCQIAAFGCAALFGISACTTAPRQRVAPSYEAQFDLIWSEYDRVYPAFAYKNVTADDWNNLRTRYRPRAAAARTEDEFISIMLDMLRPLRDVHAWFVDPKGVVVPTYVPTALENFDAARWTRALRDVGYIAHGNAWGEATIGGFAYLYIATWGAQQIDTTALDLALLRYRDAPGMIIDVRTNGGGSDATAFAFASRFAEKSYVVSYVRVRNGSNHDDLTPEQARRISPRGPFQYSKPVVVLAGRGGFSANETFVAAMRELPQVTVIGDTTGGASGNPKSYALGNGWRFTVPRWMEFGPDRQPIEWKGVAPSVAIPWTPREFYTAGDPLIDTAVGMLGELNGLFRSAPPGIIKN
ncbi:MAG: S41 family peptidase [Gemmatimonadaceae bacterium]